MEHMEYGNATQDLLRLYYKFFKFLRVFGVYEYTFHPDDPEQIVRVDKEGFFYWLQIFNVWWVVFLFFSHVVLTLVITDFLGDYPHIILLVQLPWLTGLPLCFAMHVNEMIYRKGTLQLVNFWLLLERQVFYGPGVSQSENEQYIRRQEQFLRRRIKIYLLFWATSVFPITNSTINAPYTPSFVPSLNSDAEDKNYWLDWTAKIVYGVGEPYLLHIIYIVTAGFDILIGLMCNSLILVMDKMSEEHFPGDVQAAYRQQRINSNKQQPGSAPKNPGNLSGRRLSVVNEYNAFPNIHPALSHETLFSYYKAVEMMGKQINYVYGRSMPVIQFFLAFLIAFCLYTAIQYPVHKSMELAFFEMWNFFCEGARSFTLFLPLASLYTKSQDFLSAWRRNRGQFCREHEEHLTATDRALFRAQVASCRPVQMIRGNLPLCPEDVLEYLNFVTSQAIIMIYQS